MLKLRILPLLAAALCLALPGVAHAGKNKGNKGNKPNKIIKQYDTNGNGIIDGDEVEAVRKAFTADPTGPLKQFDTNNDGKLDDTEIGAMKVQKHGKKNKNKAV
jgi:Ca2+-binding EF-hand superfamily protein